MFSFLTKHFLLVGISFLLWATLFLIRGLWEYGTVEPIPVRFLSYETDEQSGLTIHRTERLDTPQAELFDFYVFPTQFSQVQAGELGTAYVDKDVPYIVYDQAPQTESHDAAIVFTVFGLIFLGLYKLFSFGFGGFSKFKRIKDCVFVRAKVVGTTTSNISINKVPLLKLRVVPTDLNTPAGSGTQFESAPLFPETASLYPEGMEVPLWVDPKNLKNHWVGIPYF